MGTTPAQRRAIEKYHREKCDRINILAPKGTHDIYKDVAEKLGISVSKVVRLAVEEYIQNHRLNDD